MDATAGRVALRQAGPVSVRLIRIEDPGDSQVADFVGLSDAQLRRRFEDPHGGGASPHGRFIAEGLRSLEALFASPYPIRSVLVSDAQLDRVLGVLAASADEPVGSVPVLVAAQAVLDAVVGFPIHRGIVASADRLPLADPAELLGVDPGGADADGLPPTRVALLEGLNDHENLGVLFRNAAAFGIDAVLLDPRCADPLYRRSVRVSLGHALRVPYTRFAEKDWPTGALAMVADAGFEVLALTPATDATPLERVDAWPDRVAVLLGAEGAGLTDEAMDAAARRVRIPLAEGVDSLNVASAAAVAFHWLSAAASAQDE